VFQQHKSSLSWILAVPFDISFRLNMLLCYNNCCCTCLCEVLCCQLVSHCVNQQLSTQAYMTHSHAHLKRWNKFLVEYPYCHTRQYDDVSLNHAAFLWSHALSLIAFFWASWMWSVFMETGKMQCHLGVCACSLKGRRDTHDVSSMFFDCLS